MARWRAQVIAGSCARATKVTCPAVPMPSDNSSDVTSGLSFLLHLLFSQGCVESYKI
jgi:hypothetical protein